MASLKTEDFELLMLYTRATNLSGGENVSSHGFLQLAASSLAEPPSEKEQHQIPGLSHISSQNAIAHVSDVLLITAQVPRSSLPRQKRFSGKPYFLGSFPICLLCPCFCNIGLCCIIRSAECSQYIHTSLLSTNRSN